MGLRIDVVTLFPDLVEQVVRQGIPARATGRGLLELVTWNPRDYARDRHRSVDDRPYGGGPGMLMTIEPLRSGIRAARQAASPGARVVYLSPQGRRLDQQVLRRWSQGPGLILVAGRYEGVDERLITLEVDEECSIGDYVLSGGELPAMVIVDALARLQPGALGHADSATEDSFADGLLDTPHYSRPEDFQGLRVPGVLLSGNHAEIRRWRLKQALGRTCMRRPDLLRRRGMNAKERELLEQYLIELELPEEVRSKYLNAAQEVSHE